MTYPTIAPRAINKVVIQWFPEAVGEGGRACDRRCEPKVSGKSQPCGRLHAWAGKELLLSEVVPDDFRAHLVNSDAIDSANLIAPFVWGGWLRACV